MLKWHCQICVYVMLKHRCSSDALFSQKSFQFLNIHLNTILIDFKNFEALSYHVSIYLTIYHISHFS